MLLDLVNLDWMELVKWGVVGANIALGIALVVAGVYFGHDALKRSMVKRDRRDGLFISFSSIAIGVHYVLFLVNAQIYPLVSLLS